MEINIDNKNIINRLSRAEGQIRALRQAVEQNELADCSSFVIQIKAARSALKSANEQFVIDHIKKCQLLDPEERDRQISETLKVLASD